MTESLFDRMLRLAKERKGWTRAKLTIELGISKQTMTNWKARGVPPSAHDQIADVIGISIDELIGKRSREARKDAVFFSLSHRDFESLDEEQQQDVRRLVANIEGAVKRAGRKASLKPAMKSHGGHG